MSRTRQHSLQQPLIMPGGLVVLGAFWMIGAWLVAIGPRTPVQPSAATFEPGVRLLLVCISAGIFIAWPLVRLSQQSPSYPARQTLLDVAVLVAMMQLVVWLPRVLTVWSIGRTGALAAMLVGWTLIASAVVAAAIVTERRGPRNFAMAACIALCMAGPLMQWRGALSSDGLVAVVQAGPLLGVHALTEGGSTRPSMDQWSGVLVVAGAGVAAWLAVIIKAMFSRR